MSAKHYQISFYAYKVINITSININYIIYYYFILYLILTIKNSLRLSDVSAKHYQISFYAYKVINITSIKILSTKTLYHSFLMRKKFASPERRVGETLHVANDFVRCLSHCVGEAFQNLFYAQNQLIDITYIQKLSTFFKIL